MPDSVTGKLRQHELLLQISNAMTAQLDVNALLSLIIHAAVDLLAGNAGLIALRDESGELHINAAAHIPPPQWSAFAALVEHYQDPKFTSTDADLASIRIMVDMPLRHVTALPMTYHGTHIGVILVFRAALNVAFSDDEQHALLAFANHAAIAVTNARLFQTLIREKQHLSTIVEQSIDGVMILDARWRITTFNHAMEQLTGWPRDEAAGRPCAEVVGIESVDGENLCRVDCPLQRPTVGSLVQAEGWITARDGRRRYIQSTYTIQRDAQEYFAGAIVHIRDITQQKIESEMQNTFISVVSHELKTPVSIIRGYAEMLARTDIKWKPRQIKESLDIIIDEADRLTREINSLLDVSHIQLNAMPLEVHAWNIKPLIEHICQRFAAPALAQHISFEIRITDDMPDVYADRERIRIVCENLINNAIKYSPNGGVIRIHARPDNGMAIISISDQGVGIPAEEQIRIFDHGHIWVESRIGQGARFFFSIPLAITRLDGQTTDDKHEVIELTKETNHE